MKAITKDFEWTLKYDFGETKLEVGKDYTVYFDIKLRCMCVGETGKLADTQLFIAKIQLESSNKSEFKDRLKPIIKEYHEKFVYTKGEAAKRYGNEVVNKIEPQCVKKMQFGRERYQYNIQLLDYIVAHPKVKFKYSIMPKPKKTPRLTAEELQALREARNQAVISAVKNALLTTNIESDLASLISHSGLDFDGWFSSWYDRFGHKFIRDYRYGDGRIHTVVGITYDGMSQKEKISFDLNEVCKSFSELVIAHVQESSSIVQLSVTGDSVRTWYNGYALISKHGAEYCKAVKEACLNGSEFDGFNWRFES